MYRVPPLTWSSYRLYSPDSIHCFHGDDLLLVPVPVALGEMKRLSYSLQSPGAVHSVEEKGNRQQ